MSLITHNRIGAMIDEVCHKKKTLKHAEKMVCFRGILSVRQYVGFALAP